MTERFDEHLSQEQLDLMNSLDSPSRIQAFLDATPYSVEDANRSPLSVLRDRQAHCLDGGLFAAAALRRLGHPPVIVDLLPEPGLDDDHVLAIFKQNGRLGAVAKSNYAGLRFREAVYRDLRELVMSYFEFFYNIDGMKTLRAYTVPLNLEAYDPLEWMWSDANLGVIERRLFELRRYPVVTPEMVSDLSIMDQLTFEAGRLGVNEAGLYKPRK